MQTATIEIPRDEARTLYREYKKHVHYSTPVDRECQRAYQLLAQGRVIIKALASITAAGVNAQGLPKLAIARADAKGCQVTITNDGSARMRDEGAHIYWRGNGSPSKVFHFPAGSFPNVAYKNAGALLPPVPLHLRPQRGLPNYHILWEAEWTKQPPVDPYLLRRIGKADLWLVVAMWNLTEVERGALSTRMNA